MYRLVESQPKPDLPAYTAVLCSACMRKAQTISLTIIDTNCTGCQCDQCGSLEPTPTPYALPTLEGYSGMLLELWISEGYTNPDLTLRVSAQAQESEDDMIKRVTGIVKAYCTDNGIVYDSVCWELTH
jgi:hypothetical protein